MPNLNEDAVVQPASTAIVPAYSRHVLMSDGEIRNLWVGVGQEAERDILEFEVISLKSKPFSPTLSVGPSGKVLHVAVPAHVILEVVL